MRIDKREGTAAENVQPFSFCGTATYNRPASSAVAVECSSLNEVSIEVFQLKAGLLPVFVVAL